MRLSVLTLGILLAAAPSSRASVILNVPMEWVDSPQSSELDLFTSAFNCVLVDGQTLSVDFLFSNDLALHWSNAGFTTGFSFFALWDIQTDAQGFPGDPGPMSTGWLIGLDGRPITAETGRGQGDNGSLFIGSLIYNMETATITGLHFEFALPTTPYTITNSRIRLGGDSHTVLTFASQAVPEPSGLLLVSLGALGAIAGRRCRPNHAALLRRFMRQTINTTANGKTAA